MSKRVVAAAVAAALLSACGPKVWVKPGATAQDFKADKFACEKAARQNGYFGTGFEGDLNRQDFFNDCIAAHGWGLTHRQ